MEAVLSEESGRGVKHKKTLEENTTEERKNRAKRALRQKGRQMAT